MAPSSLPALLHAVTKSCEQALVAARAAEGESSDVDAELTKALDALANASVLIGQCRALDATAPASADERRRHQQRLTEAIAEEQHSAQRLRLYRQKAYSARPTSEQRLHELERAHEGAAAQVRRLRALDGGD